MNRLLKSILCFGLTFNFAWSADSCRSRMEESGQGGGGQPKSLSSLKAGQSIVGFYTCPSCGTENSARPNVHNVQQCVCGKAHEGKNLDFYPVAKGSSGFTEDQRLGVDPAKKDSEKVFGKGKKVTCPFCGSSNFRGEKKCTQCSGDLNGAKDIGHRNPEPTRPMKPEDHSLRNMAIGAGALLLGGGGYYLYTNTDTYEGEVTDLEWRHSEEVETFTKVSRRAWREDIYESSAVMPVNGQGEVAGAFNIRNCKDEFHHNDRIQVGEDVDVQPGELINNGDGSFTRGPDVVTRTPIYENVPVYKQKCDYDTYVWKSKVSDSRGGPKPAKGPLPWPNLRPGPYDRVTKSSSYEVFINYQRDLKTEKHTNKVKSESEFMSWNVGEKVMVERRKIGLVKDVKRLNAIPLEKE